MTLAVGSTGDDVKELQQQLKDGGYYSGPIDGDYGPDTEAAVRDYQSAHGLTVDGIAGAETWGNIHGDPNYPNNSAGTLGGGGAATSPSSDSSIDEKIRTELPEYAYLLDTPEIGDILRKAYSTDPPEDAGLIQSQIMGTNWWKSNSSSARDYYKLQHTDPASFQQKIWDYSDTIKTMGGELGYDETVLTPDYISYFANKAFRENLSPSQIKSMLTSEITPLIGTTEKSPVLAQIRQLEQSYQYVLDSPTQQYWLQAIGSGKQTVQNLQQSIVQQMKTLFPNLSNQFDQGLTFKQIIDPYRQALSKEFDGADPETFDFMDPKWRHVVDYVDEKTGVHRTMSMQELTNYARSQPEWRNTKNAKDQVAEIGDQLLRSFGAIK